MAAFDLAGTNPIRTMSHTALKQERIKRQRPRACQRQGTENPLASEKLPRQATSINSAIYSGTSYNQRLGKTLTQHGRSVPGLSEGRPRGRA